MKQSTDTVLSWVAVALFVGAVAFIFTSDTAMWVLLGLWIISFVAFLVSSLMEDKGLYKEASFQVSNGTFAALFILGGIMVIKLGFVLSPEEGVISVVFGGIIGLAAIIYGLFGLVVTATTTAEEIENFRRP